MMIFTRSIFVFSFATLLVSCAQNPATGSYHLNLVSDAERTKLGQETATAAVEEYGGLYDEKERLTQYMGLRVDDIVRVSETPSETFRLRLLDTSLVNAFATPGFTMINRGILPYFNSEAEMMTVVGHEVGHVSARHVEQSLSGGRLLNVLLQGANIAMQQGGVGAGTVNSVNQLSGIVGSLGMRKWGREHELQADELGLRYISRLCYDPMAAVDGLRVISSAYGLYDEVLKVMGERTSSASSDDLLSSLMSSHPDTQFRLSELAAKASATPSCGKDLYQDRYYQMIDGMAFGPSIDEGTGGKNRYYDSHHPVTFTLPEGWFFPNLYDTPLAVNSKTQVTLLAGLQKVERSETPKEILVKSFPSIGHVSKNASGDLTVYAAVVDGSQMAEQTSAIHVLFAFKLKDDGEEMIVFNFIAKDKAAYEKAKADITAIGASIKRIPSAYVSKLQPMRVQIYRVKAGDTIAKLAEKMDIGALRMEYFLALNGLSKNADLKMGQKVKLVVDPNKNLKF